MSSGEHDGRLVDTTGLTTELKLSSLEYSNVSMSESEIWTGGFYTPFLCLSLPCSSVCDHPHNL